MAHNEKSIGETLASSASAVDTTIHVVDDDDSFRTAVTRLLAAQGYTVLQYKSAEQMLGALHNPERGCILLDVAMPGLSGPQLQEHLNRAYCPLPIIFLTGHGDFATTVRTIKAGAEDFLSKPVSKSQLTDAIERALRRFDIERARLVRLGSIQKLMSGLTPRENQVFRLVIQGKLNKQIAQELGAAERTIKAHRHNLMVKLHVKSVAELVLIGEELKIMPH